MNAWRAFVREQREQTAAENRWRSRMEQYRHWRYPEARHERPYDQADDDDADVRRDETDE